ncbi:MAG: porin [Burkholderiaceae bacterium]|nr:porin [Burkholderiaceae bacterium]
MKKSLIALAVLAASGASFAQVSITGFLAYGYQSTTTGGIGGAGTSDTAGLGADTARLFFTANEDLGGGFAAKASMSINTNPQAVATGEDQSLMLTTPAGALVLGTAKAVDYLSGFGSIAGVGAYYAGWNSTDNAAGGSDFDKLFTARTKRDYAAFIIPVGAFKFSLSQHEGAGETAFGSGMTGGTSSAASGGGTGAAISGGSSAPVTTLGATYDAGPLVANGQYAVYKNSGLQNAVKDTTRLSAAYDLGMVKLGGGLVISNHNTNVPGASAGKTSDYLIAANVPMGASSFGLSFASRTVADVVPGYSATGTGYSLQYGYAMSKRTGVVANYARWTAVGGAGAVPNRDASSQYQMLLTHSF